MLSTRLVSGLMMVAAVVAGLCVDEYFAPWYPCWLLITGFVLVIAARELTQLLDGTSARPSGNSVVGGVLALVAANWLPHIAAGSIRAQPLSALTYDPAAPFEVLSWPFLTFIAILMVSFVIQSLQFEKPGRTMAKISGTILAVAYVGLLGSFTIQMRWFAGNHEGLLALLYLIATAKGADTGAYAFGRLAGRHKLWPSLSPKKTVEGAVGGLACSVASVLLVEAFARLALDVRAFDWYATIGYGLLIGAVAQLGDLMESMIKRDCDRKDASRTVPGFGGVLDVIDSLIFAGPVAYCYWLWFSRL
jgi:phosphatidate cytidylyltransferase